MTTASNSGSRSISSKLVKMRFGPNVSAKVFRRSASRSQAAYTDPSDDALRASAWRSPGQPKPTIPTLIDRDRDIVEDKTANGAGRQLKEFRSSGVAGVQELQNQEWVTGWTRLRSRRQ